MRYQDKSLEEVREVVSTYLENHKKRTGKDLNPIALIQKLEELALEKEERAFQSAFEGQTVSTIMNAIQALKETSPAPTEPKPIIFKGPDTSTKQDKSWKWKGNKG